MAMCHDVPGEAKPIIRVYLLEVGYSVFVPESRFKKLGLGVYLLLESLFVCIPEPCNLAFYNRGFVLLREVRVLVVHLCADLVFYRAKNCVFCPSVRDREVDGLDAEDDAEDEREKNAEQGNYLPFMVFEKG